jgi:alkylation response protein AidB-like acyl-CoA dehydrogenase
VTAVDDEYESAWQRLAPGALHRTRPLSAIDAYLREPETACALAELERSGEYPRGLLSDLRELSLAELLVPERAASPELGTLNAMLARHSGSLAITVGVNALALLPVYLSGTDTQRELVTRRLRAGAAASLLLTEREHGSNLLRNQATAWADGDGFVLDGAKQLINGGTEHEILVALLRTRPRAAGAPAAATAAFRDFTLFLVERRPGVVPLARHATLPARAADISGVRLDGARVGGQAVIGRVGEGFALVQKTLMISRGGICALASGAASGALRIALDYARERAIYRGPIVEMGAIAEHLVRMAALDVVVAAAAVKAAFAANRFGSGAGHLGAAAKYACCRFAEEAVTEGRYVLGAQALLEDGPYPRFVRDVLLYGVFDGTSHVLLDQLSPALLRQDPPQGSTLEAVREIYGTPPRPLVQAALEPWRPYAPALAPRCAELARASGSEAVAALAGLAQTLAAVGRAAKESGSWDADQALRFEAAALLAELEALLAACELALPECRRVLGLDERARIGAGTTGDADADHAAAEYAVEWLGGRIAYRLRELARAAGPKAEAETAAEAWRAHSAVDAHDRLRAYVREG